MKSVLITGASRGMGKCIAKELSENGYKVFGTCRDSKKVSDPLPNVTYVDLDVTIPESIEALPKKVGHIDILINNAGQSQIGALEETPISKYKDLFEINVFGLIHTCQVFLPSMREKKSGMIINIGSLTGKFPLPYYSSYCGSKYAVEGITQGLRNELMDFGIKVVLLDPNDIKTTITPEFICKESSPYFPFANKVREMVKSKMAHANPPEVISDAVLKIVKSKNPKPVYNVGGNAKMLVFLKNLVTTSFLHNSIRKSYGLGK